MAGLLQGFDSIWKKIRTMYPSCHTKVFEAKRKGFENQPVWLLTDVAFYSSFTVSM